MLHLFSHNLLFHFSSTYPFSLSHTPYLPLCPLADPCAHFSLYKGVKNVNYYYNSRLFWVSQVRRWSMAWWRVQACHLHRVPLLCCNMTTLFFILYFQDFVYKTPSIHNFAQNPCHPCGPVMVLTVSGARLAFYTGWPIQHARGILILCCQTVILSSVLNSSVPWLNPDDSVPDEEIPNTALYIHVSLSVLPSWLTTSISPLFRYRISSISFPNNIKSVLPNEWSD